MEGSNSKSNSSSDEMDALMMLMNDVDEIENTEKQKLLEKERLLRESERVRNIDHEKETNGWTGENQIERILQKNYEWFNLNPFYVFGFQSYEVTEDDISSRYRKISRLVHPDKQKDKEKARSAFEEVKKAYALLQDKEMRAYYVQIHEECKNHVQNHWKQLKKKGMSDDDIVKAEGTFEEAVDKKMKVDLASKEYAKQRSQAILKKNEEREKNIEEEKKKIAEEEKKLHKEFMDGSESRAKAWLEFQSASKRTCDKED